MDDIQRRISSFNFIQRKFINESIESIQSRKNIIEKKKAELLKEEELLRKSESELYEEIEKIECVVNEGIINHEHDILYNHNCNEYGYDKPFLTIDDIMWNQLKKNLLTKTINDFYVKKNVIQLPQHNFIYNYLKPYLYQGNNIEKEWFLNETEFPMKHIYNDVSYNLNELEYNITYFSKHKNIYEGNYGGRLITIYTFHLKFFHNNTMIYQLKCELSGDYHDKELSNMKRNTYIGTYERDHNQRRLNNIRLKTLHKMIIEHYYLK